MPALLKNVYNEAFVESLSIELENHYQSFEKAHFKKDIFDTSWADRELKGRMRHLAIVLGKHLPQNYQQALQVLKPVSERFVGIEAMIFPDFVEVYGLGNYQASVDALEHFTPFASSEFAVRPFIVRYKDRMMGQMSRWAESDNFHIRRLASEGCRPRLPWAMALPQFRKEPAPVLKILEKLKNDPSNFVRRSVANNLNDISKDNPAVFLTVAKNWLGVNPGTDWIIKHGSRTLLKSGEPAVLALFGYKKPAHIAVKILSAEKEVKWGGELEFSFTLESRNKSLGKIRIEYAIDFMKANGKQIRKIFKISESDYKVKKKDVVRPHSFKEITTRKYYAGDHNLAIIINGHEMGSRRFRLTRA